MWKRYRIAILSIFQRCYDKLLVSSCLSIIFSFLRNVCIFPQSLLKVTHFCSNAIISLLYFWVKWCWFYVLFLYCLLWLSLKLCEMCGHCFHEKDSLCSIFTIISSKTALLTGMILLRPFFRKAPVCLVVFISFIWWNVFQIFWINYV